MQLVPTISHIYVCWKLNRYEAYTRHTKIKYGYSDMEDPSPLVYIARMINDDKRTSRFTQKY